MADSHSHGSLKLKGPNALRVFDILEAVAADASALTLDEVARATGIPKPTAHRLLQTLARAGVLLRDAKARSYSVGPRLNSLGITTLTNAHFRAVRHQIVSGVVEAVGETCNFTTLDGREVVYVDRVESGWPLRFHLAPGSHVPIHCTASGKLFLSQMPARERKQFLYAAPLKRYTPKTVTDPAVLERELKHIRRKRISTDNEGFLAGLISVAIPVVDQSRRTFAAVAVHGPKTRLTLPKVLRYVPILQDAAARLGELYGSNPAKREGDWP